MTRKSPVRHVVRAHRRRHGVVSSFVRGRGQRRALLANPVCSLARIRTVPMEEVATTEYLLIPNGDSKSGENWRNGVMQASSFAGVKRNVSILKAKGWMSGRILAPHAAQEERMKGFVVIGHWGRVSTARSHVTKYTLDKDILQDEMNWRRGKKVVKWMSPEEFLKQCLSPDSHYANAYDCPGVVIDGKCAFNRAKIDAYIAMIAKDEAMPPLIIDRTAKVLEHKYVGHDGRHRAKAAWFMGVKRVPVLVIEGDGK